MRLKILFLGLMMVLPFTVYAGRFAFSTNLLGYAELGTMNMEASYAISRRWNLTVGARYNPFTYNKRESEKQFQYRQQSYSLGARLWPWHTWSGWWFAAKARYQEYNMGGIVSRETSEGDRIGMGLYSGYTVMISKHFNMEFGVGFWTGLDMYRTYSCPICGVTMNQGNKAFILPDDIIVSVVYVF